MSEQNNEAVFLDGFIFKRPREGAPDFVKGSMSIKVSEAVDFLKKHDNNGWVVFGTFLFQGFSTAFSLLKLCVVMASKSSVATLLPPKTLLDYPLTT